MFWMGIGKSFDKAGSIGQKTGFGTTGRAKVRYGDIALMWKMDSKIEPCSSGLSRAVVGRSSSPKRSLRTTMPEVIDGNVGGPAFTVGPLEVSSMLADVDGFGFRTSGGSEFWADLEALNRAQ
jgi:hypothetical protein